MLKQYQSKLLGNTGITRVNEFSFKTLPHVSNPNSVHGLFPYRGKISAIDAQQVIHQLPQEGVLLDPFCGSGTIVYEAQQWGLRAIGVDNNPLACTLSRAKTQPIDVLKTVKHAGNLVLKANKLCFAKRMNDWPIRFFHEKTAEQIMKLLSFKNEMCDYELGAFYGSIALSARVCNHYKWSSNSIGKIVGPPIMVNFFEIFLKKIKKHIRFVDGNKPAIIHRYDTRKISDIIGLDSVDYIYTSPPYFDALDYTSYYGRIVYEIVGDYDRKEIKNSLIQKYSNYPQDMRDALMELRRVLKKGAIVLFVVGDKKTPEGKIINGGEFFSNLTSWKPTRIVEREYSGSSSQIWDAINKTKRKEQIVIWSNEC